MNVGWLRYSLYSPHHSTLIVQALLLAGCPCCPLSLPLPGRVLYGQHCPGLPARASKSLALPAWPLPHPPCARLGSFYMKSLSKFASMHSCQCMDKRELSTKLPLPIAAHVKSLGGLQVSHFWADLLDHRYLHGKQVLIWRQKTWQRMQLMLATHGCHGINAMPLHYAFPVCTDIRCARAVPVIALLQAPCQCLRWRTCLARSRLSYSSSIRLCCSACTFAGDDFTDATKRLRCMLPTGLGKASFTECSEKHAWPHEGSISRVGHRWEMQNEAVRLHRAQTD